MRECSLRTRFQPSALFSRLEPAFVRPSPWQRSRAYIGERETRNAGGPDLLSAERLVREVAAVLSRKARPGRHHIAAGLLAADGGSFTALNLVSNLGAASSCAEQAALAAALQATTSPITLVVSLRATFDQAARNEVIPPCGRCRELLAFPFRSRKGGHG